MTIHKWWHRLTGVADVLDRIEDARIERLKERLEAHKAIVPVVPVEFQKAMEHALRENLHQFSRAQTNEQRCFYQGVCFILQDLLEAPERYRQMQADDEARARAEEAYQRERQERINGRAGLARRTSRP